MGRSTKPVFRGKPWFSLERKVCPHPPGTESAQAPFRRPAMRGRLLVSTRASRPLSPHLLLQPAWRSTLPPHLTARLLPLPSLQLSGPDYLAPRGSFRLQHRHHFLQEASPDCVRGLLHTCTAPVVTLRWHPSALRQDLPIRSPASCSKMPVSRDLA